MQACAALATATSSLGRLVDYVTCSATGGGAAAQNTPLAAAVLGAALTIYVALIGYQLMLGRAYDPRAAAFSALRMGVVIAFCTSGSAYGVIVERVALEGPFELASAIVSPTGPALSRPAEAAETLQVLYDQVRTGVRRQAADVVSGRAETADTPAAGGQTSLLSAGERPAAPTFESQAGQGLLISSVGTYLALRMAAGLLLALGPLLIPLGLFNITLGLVEGWIRALIGVTLGAASAIVISAYELSFLQGELARATPDDPTALDERGLHAIVLVFGVAGWIAAAAFTLVAFGFRPRWFVLPRIARPAADPPASPSLVAASRATTGSVATPSRAQMLAGVIVDQGRLRREAETRAEAVSPRTSTTLDQVGLVHQGYASRLGERRAPRLGATSSVASRERRK